MVKSHLNSISRALHLKGFTKNFRRREECDTLIGWLGACPGDRILDIGCGKGDLDFRISRTGAHVVGIDVNREALAIARVTNASIRTEFHYMDAESLEFPDRSFDKAISFCVIEHFQREDRALAEVSRVLKPGALFVFSADSLSNPEITDNERAAHRTRYFVNTFYTPEIVNEKLATAGFDTVHTRYILTNPVSLGLARFTWKFDDLPAWAGFVADVGYYVTGTVGKAVADLSEMVYRREDSGLTLLVIARKR